MIPISVQSNLVVVILSSSRSNNLHSSFFYPEFQKISLLVFFFSNIPRLYIIFVFLAFVKKGLEVIYFYQKSRVCEEWFLTEKSSRIFQDDVGRFLTVLLLCYLPPRAGLRNPVMITVKEKGGLDTGSRTPSTLGITFVPTNYLAGSKQTRFEDHS